MELIFQEITEDKKAYLELLLLADEQEDMIDRYLDRGRMFAAYEKGHADKPEEAVAVCVVTKEDPSAIEIKNLAVREDMQGKGIGRYMIDRVCSICGKVRSIVLVGTGESRETVGFYEKCGFTYSHRIKDFFIDNYDHPIVEGGVLLRDMVYFRKSLENKEGLKDED